MRLRLLPTHPTLGTLFADGCPLIRIVALDADGCFAAVLQWHCGVAILEVRHAQIPMRRQ
jgi:hypothetical protein